MARNFFREILQFWRFDVHRTRSVRLQTETSVLWNRFVDNSISCHKPGANITIGKQLFSTKARCRFTKYIPKKPDKFGIKFWLAVNVETKYILNAIPDLGKNETREPSHTLSDWVVMNRVEPYLGKGRNVTTDSFFKSFGLAKKLRQKKKNNIGGTANKIRRKLPPSAKITQATTVFKVFSKRQMM